eukprot:TRINITY_DN1033_c0_g1_i1.p1 TRINITY_DN1033_c0_g1~~TRINITY_DN1033_c0_g1_i1.p1  ORF type:complete len:532 (-),score=117.18 TRINITY_DN1033_c0_g1_i1:452-2047(-)
MSSLLKKATGRKSYVEPKGISDSLIVDVQSPSFNARMKDVLKQSAAAQSDAKDPLLTPEPITFNKVPKSVPYILAQECCERFSFYGMKTVLFVYLNEYHNFSDNTSTAIVHLFIAYAYLTPLVGGILSDSYLGKYKTILYLSVVYAMGSIILALTANKDITGGSEQFWGCALGLVLIGFGTGGIKPCVSSFIGDQFTAEQAAMLTSVFAWFYFAINTGSLASTFLSPVIREEFGFEYAFGVPAVLLLIATFVFYLGRRHYRMVPLTENVLATFYRVVKVSLIDRYQRGFFSPSRQLDHWMDGAKNYYDNQLVEDCKAVMSVLRIFTPIPVFWMLYDQVTTRWTIQAEEMDRNIGSYTIPEDQVQVLNPLMILFLIPIFDRGVYPFMDSIGMRLSMLTRMTVGMTLTAITFVIAGFVQLAIDDAGEGELSVFWQVPQYFILSCSEIMVSITGLEFAYANAPTSMKSIVMASWQLTVAVGNIVVAIIAEVSFFDAAAEFFFFAALMGMFVVLFFFVARNFKPPPPSIPSTPNL